jgi:hypothetical protein
MSGLAPLTADEPNLWPLSPGDGVLSIGVTADHDPARTVLSSTARASLAPLGDARRVAAGARSLLLGLARLGGDAAARPLDAPSAATEALSDTLDALVRDGLRPGLVVLEAAETSLAACLEALERDAQAHPAMIAIVRGAADAAGRWDRPLFDAGYVRLKPGACRLLNDGADPYIRSALLTDLDLLREPSGNAVSMDSLGTNGRFGNQLFQFAFLALYALRNNCSVQSSRWIGQMLYGIASDPPDPSFRRQGFALFTGVERHLWTMAEPPVNVDFWGYFQEIPASWRRHRALLRRIFTPRPLFVDLIERWMTRTIPAEATLVGIHVRRGDYPHFNHAEMPWFRPIPVEWYDSLLRELWPSLERPMLFIATDDEKSVTPHFAPYDPVIAPAYELALPEIGFLPDFMAMQRSAVLATVNSSFSRMAALLADDGQVVYLPNMKSGRFERYEPWLDEDFWARFEA